MTAIHDSSKRPKSSLQSIGVHLPEQSLDDIIRDAVKDALAHRELLERVATAERERRAARSFQRRLSKSRIGQSAPVADFNFEHPSRIDRRLVDDAFSLRFVEDGGAVVFVGPPGLGKTHLAKALVHAALAAGHRALFADAAHVVEDLAAASRSGRLRTRLRHYLKPHLLCLDALAYTRLDHDRLDALYELVRARHHARRALLVTTATPFAQWHTLMPSTAATAAVVDRLADRGLLIAIEGTSYRRARAERRAAGARAGAPSAT